MYLYVPIYMFGVIHLPYMPYTLWNMLWMFDCTCVYIYILKEHMQYMYLLFVKYKLIQTAYVQILYTQVHKYLYVFICLYCICI